MEPKLTNTAKLRELYDMLSAEFRDSDFSVYFYPNGKPLIAIYHKEPTFFGLGRRDKSKSSAVINYTGILIRKPIPQKMYNLVVEWSKKLKKFDFATDVKEYLVD